MIFISFSSCIRFLLVPSYVPLSVSVPFRCSVSIFWAWIYFYTLHMSVKLWTISIFYFSLLVCTYLYFLSLPAESFLYLSLSIRIPYHFFFLARVFIRLEGDSWLLVGGAAASKAFIYWPSFPTFCCWECRRQEETSSA